jgi:hypothetical protein
MGEGDADYHQEEGPRPTSESAQGQALMRRGKCTFKQRDVTAAVKGARAAGYEVEGVAGLPERVIAEIMGWEEEHLTRIIHRYVHRAAATKAIIAQLNERRT